MKSIKRIKETEVEKIEIARTKIFMKCVYVWNRIRLSLFSSLSFLLFSFFIRVVCIFQTFLEYCNTSPVPRVSSTSPDASFAPVFDVVACTPPGTAIFHARVDAVAPASAALYRQRASAPDAWDRTIVRSCASSRALCTNSSVLHSAV